MAADSSLTQELYQKVDMNKFIEAIDELGTEYATGDHFKNKLLVLDDIGALSVDPKKQKIFWNFIDMALENMRKKNTSIYLISHVSTNYKQTRTLIGEIHKYIVYPNCQQVQSDRLLSHYLGLTKKQVRKITSEEKSRWVVIDCRRRLCMSDHEIYTLIEED